MKSIEDIYEELSFDETIFFQIRTKRVFNKVIKEMKKVIDKWDWIWIEDILDYKNTYFILGHWRAGMFELRVGEEQDDETQIHILADYKENPVEMSRHLKQIESIIKIMDNYRHSFIKKKMKLDEHFNLVKE